MLRAMDYVQFPRRASEGRRLKSVRQGLLSQGAQKILLGYTLMNKAPISVSSTAHRRLGNQSRQQDNFSSQHRPGNVIMHASESLAQKFFFNPPNAVRG